MRTRFGKYAADGTLDRWGACGEDDAWRWVGTSVRGDRHGPAQWVRHDPSLPHLNKRGSHVNTNAATLDRNRRERDRDMAMSVADERVRARCISRLTSGQMPVDVLPLMVCGLAVSLSVFGPRCTVVVAMRVRVYERRRSAGRH